MYAFGTPGFEIYTTRFVLNEVGYLELQIPSITM